MGDMERCLKEKASLLQSMLAGTRKIGEMLASQDMDGLNAAVEARQACIGKIDEIDRHIKLLGEQGRADAVRSRLQGEIRGLLGEILEVDAANMKAASDATATLMQGIREVNAEKNLLRYQPVAPAGSRFVDREG